MGTAEVAASECLPTFGFSYEDFPFITVKTAEVDAPECLPSLAFSFTAGDWTKIKFKEDSE